MSSNSSYNVATPSVASIGWNEMINKYTSAPGRALASGPTGPQYHDIYGKSDIRNNTLGTLGQWGNKGLRFAVPGTEYLQKAI